MTAPPESPDEPAAPPRAAEPAAATRNPVLPWVTAPVAWLLALCVLAKLARALELSQRLGTGRPFLVLPATLGQDAVVIAAVGLLAHALIRIRDRRLRWAALLLVLVPIGMLMPADVISQRLTGRPITLQRLRGDEGATLKDLDLLATSDLVTGTLGVALALALLPLAFRYAARVPALRKLARSRPLLVMLVLGFAVSVLQGALLTRAHGLEEQPVLVLLQSLTGTHGVAGLRLSDREWRTLSRPTLDDDPAPKAPVVRGRAKNVVMFLAEGIPYKDTGFDKKMTKRKVQGRKLADPTPNLTRRFRDHGLVFDRYYANWHASIQALFSIACSAYPPMSGDIVRIKPRIDCGAMSEQMRASNVLPGLFHGGQFNFYNKLALLGRRGNAIELDAEELAKTSKRARNQWGIDDRAMTDATLAWIDSLPKGQRFSALLIPITAHYPYWVPPDFKKPFRPLTRQERFLNAVAFQDQVIEELMQAFEKRGLYDDTLFVWLGDHGHYVGEPDRETPGLRAFYEPNIHTPLLLLNRRMFANGEDAKTRRNKRLGSHVDLLPTLLDALGLPADRRHQGQSLLAPDFEPRRVFYGAEDGRYVGFIDGHHKFTVDMRGKRTEYYDLNEDPEELENLSESYPERMQELTDVAVRFARGVTARIEDAPLLEEKVSVDKIYELFLEHVSVRVGTSGALTDCGRGANTACEGLGRVMRIKTERMQGEKRRCVMVKLPTEGRIELTVDHRDTLDLLTGTIVAMPGTPKGRPAIRVDTTTDGKRTGSATLTREATARPGHPKATRQLRFGFERVGEDREAPREVCMQLTMLFSG